MIKILWIASLVWCYINSVIGGGGEGGGGNIGGHGGVGNDGFGGGLLEEPRARSFDRDVIRRLPPQLRGFDNDRLRRLPRGFVRRRFGERVARDFWDNNDWCGGARFNRGNFRRLRRGDRFNLRFRVDDDFNGAGCVARLMCPGRGVGRRLWSGDCSRRNVYNHNMILPGDIDPSGEGECFMQWEMQRGRDIFNECSDLVID